MEGCAVRDNLAKRPVKSPFIWLQYFREQWVILQGMTQSETFLITKKYLRTSSYYIKIYLEDSKRGLTQVLWYKGRKFYTNSFPFKHFLGWDQIEEAIQNPKVRKKNIAIGGLFPSEYSQSSNLLVLKVAVYLLP